MTHSDPWSLGHLCPFSSIDNPALLFHIFEGLYNILSVGICIRIGQFYLSFATGCIKDFIQIRLILVIQILKSKICITENGRMSSGADGGYIFVSDWLLQHKALCMRLVIWSLKAFKGPLSAVR